MRLNWLIIIPVLLLVIIGILSIWSAAPISSPGMSGLSEGKSFLSRLLTHQPARQMVFAVVSFIVFIGLLFINYSRWRDYAYVIYLVILGLITILVIWGRVTHGARRWIPIGPFALQPSEFMKIALVLALARLMMYKKSLNRLIDFLPPVILTVIPMVLVLLQPSLGMALVLFPTFLVMVFVAGAPRRNLTILLIIILIALPIGYFGVLKDYQRARLKAFINPSQSPSSDGFQLIQSIVTSGSGGLSGRGPHEPSPFVPERHNDFIFTNIAERGGFIGSSFIILLYLILYLSALFMAYATRDAFGRLIIVGLVTYLAVQTFINIGMTIGLAPITGITLPFVSYGGSSLLSSFIALGLIVNIGMHPVPSFAAKDFE